MNSVVHHQWGVIKQHKSLLSILVANGVLIILHWVIVVYKSAPTDLPIFLHYNTILGIDVTGPWYGLFVLPLTATVIFGVNLIVSLIREDLFSLHTLLIVSLLSEIGLLAGSILLFLKNA